MTTHSAASVKSGSGRKKLAAMWIAAALILAGAWAVTTRRGEQAERRFPEISFLLIFGPYEHRVQAGIEWSNEGCEFRDAEISGRLIRFEGVRRDREARCVPGGGQRILVPVDLPSSDIVIEYRGNRGVYQVARVNNDLVVTLREGDEVARLAKRVYPIPDWFKVEQ